MKESTPAPPEDGLLARPAYALAQLHHALTGSLESELAEIGLSLRTHQVLVCVAGGSGHSQQQVSDTVDVDRSEMVRIIDRLEEAGMIVREPDPADRRRHQLRLTSPGRRALKRGEEIVKSATEQALASLSAEERRLLHALTVRALADD